MIPKPSVCSPARALTAAGVAPKLIGSDTELGNLLLGLELEHGTGALASRALLREIHGLPRASGGGSLAELRQSLDEPVANRQDWGRKYLPANGGCCYNDLDHLELCTPEVLSAYDYAAAFHALLRLARQALRNANARLPDGLKLAAVVNNSDGQGHSYGAHLNFLMTATAWDRLFHRRLHELLTLASFQVSSIILTGQGKVGPERPRGCRGEGFFELSQRAALFECLVGSQTTYNRPIVNSRDEALCGRFTAVGCPSDTLARLHCIFFDATLCPASLVLKAGLMQILLCLIEAGEIDSQLILDDPVETVSRWSRDPLLSTRARLISGAEVTALELQQRFFERAAQFVEHGGCDGAVPRARDILTLWAETLDHLRRRNLAALTGRLDWVLKLSLLEHARQQQPGLTWSSPEIKYLDFKYADLDEGLFWNLDQAGVVDRLGLTEDQVLRFTQEPPDNTRAWTRAHLLRLADPATVAEVDWDQITFALRDAHGFEKRRTVRLANPLGFTQRDTGVLFRRPDSLDEVLDLLGAPERDPVGSSSGTSSWASPATYLAYPAPQPPDQAGSADPEGPTPPSP